MLEPRPEVPDGARISASSDGHNVGYVIRFDGSPAPELLADVARYLVLGHLTSTVQINAAEAWIGITGSAQEIYDYQLLAELKELFQPALQGIGHACAHPISLGFQAELYMMGADEKTDNVMAARLLQLQGILGAHDVQGYDQRGVYVLTFRGPLTQERADELTAAFAEIGINAKVYMHSSSLAVWMV